jgi:hypothetical protein
MIQHTTFVIKKLQQKAVFKQKQFNQLILKEKQIVAINLQWLLG